MGITYSSENSLKQLQSEYDKQLNRQIVLLDHYWQHKRAEQFAARKEIIVWEVISFGTIASVLLYTGLKKKNKAFIIPIIPIITWIGYRSTLSSDEYMSAVNNQAQEILNDPKKRRLVSLAGGRITLTELDERRRKWKDGLIGRVN